MGKPCGDAAAAFDASVCILDGCPAADGAYVACSDDAGAGAAEGEGAPPRLRWVMKLLADCGRPVPARGARGAQHGIRPPRIRTPPPGPQQHDALTVWLYLLQLQLQQVCG